MKLEPVQWGRRFAGHLFDTISIVIITGIINPSNSNSDLKDSLITAGCFFLYFCLFEVFTDTTLGKLIVGTEVVTINNGVPDSEEIFFRSICRLIPLEFLSFLFQNRPIGLHDKFSHTKVVLSKELKEFKKIKYHL